MIVPTPSSSTETTTTTDALYSFNDMKHEDYFKGLECGIGIVPTLCNDTSLNDQMVLHNLDEAEPAPGFEPPAEQKYSKLRWRWDVVVGIHIPPPTPMLPCAFNSPPPPPPNPIPPPTCFPVAVLPTFVAKLRDEFGWAPRAQQGGQDIYLWIEAAGRDGTWGQKMTGSPRSELEEAVLAVVEREVRPFATRHDPESMIAAIESEWATAPVPSGANFMSRTDS